MSGDIVRAVDAELIVDGHDLYHSDREFWSRSAIVDYAQGREDGDFEPFYRRWISRVDDGREETDALRIGKGAHAIALKDAFELPKMVEIPREVLSVNGKRQGNRWTEFRLRSANKGKTLLTPAQYALCHRLSKALTRKIGHLLEHPRAERELEHRWLQDGFPCRLKADLVVVIDEEVYCIDLKTARSVNKRALHAEIRDRKLWLQDAHYSAGLRDRYGLPVRFFFACVEKHGSHRVRLVELEFDTRLRAAENYRILVKEMQGRCLSNDWVHPDSDFVETLKLTDAEMGFRRLEGR